MAFRASIGLYRYAPAHPAIPPNPLPVRQASILPAASFRFRLAADTLAVQLALPLAGRAGDLHPQVVQFATTANQTAPFTALRAMPGAHKKTAPLEVPFSSAVQPAKAEARITRRRRDAPPEQPAADLPSPAVRQPYWPSPAAAAPGALPLPTPLFPCGRGGMPDRYRPGSGGRR